MRFTPDTGNPVEFHSKAATFVSAVEGFTFAPAGGVGYRVKRIAIGVGLACGVLVAGVAVAASYLSGPPQERGAGPPVTFTVHPGEPFGAVAARLADQRLVRSELVLRIVAHLQGADIRIRAGHYSFAPSLRARQVLALLLEGRQEEVTVTFPEGWTVRRIAERLEERGVTTAGAFTAAVADPALTEEFGIRAASMEGYLFPDTYRFPRDYPAADVVRSLVGNFFRRLAQVRPDFESIDPDKLHDTIILASIVEREYQRPEEAGLIASVFVNRLAADAGLQSCATVAYVLTEVQGREHPRVITHAELEVDSAYNTYKWRGLPPAPISNPGAVALQAAFFPEESDYWYFVLKDPDTGEHHFSRELKEHNDAKFFYLKGVAG